MNVKMFGYARVSNKKQNEGRQVLELKKIGIEERDIYIDKLSGKDFERGECIRLKGNLREGNIIVIKSLDRFGRNYQMIKHEWDDITNNIKAYINIIDMPLLNTNQDVGKLETVISDIVLTLLSYVAEQEIEFINKRQREGITIAKQKGIKFGRPRIPIPENFNEFYAKWERNEIKAVDVRKN